MTDFFVIACPVCFEQFTLPDGTGAIPQHECKAMNQAEDETKGLMAIQPEVSKPTLQFGRMKYDGKLKAYRSDCVLNLADFQTWRTKREAVCAAKAIGFPASHVERIGSRFCLAWGIRHDHRDGYFLATYD